MKVSYCLRARLTRDHLTSPKEQILGTVGPMSTSLDGLRILMKTVIEARPWLVEPSLMNVEWKSANQVCPESYSPQNKLKIGIMWHDGVVYPQPPVQRALRELVDRLISISWIEVVDWVPWAHDDACRFRSLFLSKTKTIF